MFFVLAIVITLMACKHKDLDSNTEFGYSGSSYVNLFVKDSNGKDLLNPSNPNAYQQYNLRVFYLKDGKKSEVLDTILYQIMPYNDSLFCLHLQCYYTIYLQWNMVETDTLECRVNDTGHGLILLSILYNGKPISFIPNYGTAIEIIKK